MTGINASIVVGIVRLTANGRELIESGSSVARARERLALAVCGRRTDGGFFFVCFLLRRDEHLTTKTYSPAVGQRRSTGYICPRAIGNFEIQTTTTSHQCVYVIIIILNYDRHRLARR